MSEALNLEGSGTWCYVRTFQAEGTVEAKPQGQEYSWYV